MSIPKDHPYWFISDLVEKEGQIDFLSFSYYQYKPQSIVDERKIFHVKRKCFFDIEFISSLMNRNDSMTELAIHSKVVLLDGTERHIPMVDMATAAKAHLSKVQILLKEKKLGSFEWFSSGRSFHGYGKILLNEVEWIHLMGILLLSNQRGLNPTVDPRWIGHRLLAGYSALRWTRNSHHYVGIPSSVEI